MMKAILLIWIGLAQTQTLTIEKFDSLQECLSARAAIAAAADKNWYTGKNLSDGSICVEYRAD